MKRYGIWALSLAVLWIGIAAAEDTYRWQDDSGRLHFSNVGPSEPPPGEESFAAPAEPAPERAEQAATPPVPRAAPSTEEKPGPYASLSPESFSRVVSRKRAELRRDLAAAKRELQEIEDEMASHRRTRDQTFERYAQQLQGITSSPRPPLEDDEALVERHEAAKERVDSIRASYEELADEAVKRYGGLPPWWLPLE